MVNFLLFLLVVGSCLMSRKHKHHVTMIVQHGIKGLPPTQKCLLVFGTRTKVYGKSNYFRLSQEPLLLPRIRHGKRSAWADRLRGNVLGSVMEIPYFC